MKRQSTKTKKRVDECREFRRLLLEEVGRCEMCGLDPLAEYGPGPESPWWLVVHEIARGPKRLDALDKRFAVLVLCWWCHAERVHSGKEAWPEERQLAALRESRPDDYDLKAYNDLVGKGPKRITEREVNRWTTGK